jgi:hypothetical protein
MKSSPCPEHPRLGGQVAGVFFWVAKMLGMDGLKDLGHVF